LRRFFLLFHLSPHRNLLKSHKTHHFSFSIIPFSNVFLATLRWNERKIVLYFHFKNLNAL
jgi:hypothetical protein